MKKVLLLPMMLMGVALSFTSCETTMIRARALML